MLQHLLVKRANLATRTRWVKIFLQALAAPRGLDDEDGFVKRVANNVAKAELRTDGRWLGAEPGSEFASAPEVPDRDIVALDPFAVLVLEVLVIFRVRREVAEAALAAVALRVALDPACPFHVGLACKDEHLDRRFFRVGGNGEPQADDEGGESSFVHGCSVTSLDAQGIEGHVKVARFRKRTERGICQKFRRLQWTCHRLDRAPREWTKSTIRVTSAQRASQGRLWS